MTISFSPVGLSMYQKASGVSTSATASQMTILVTITFATTFAESSGERAASFTRKSRVPKTANVAARLPTAPAVASIPKSAAPRTRGTMRMESSDATCVMSCPERSALAVRTIRLDSAACDSSAPVSPLAGKGGDAPGSLLAFRSSPGASDGAKGPCSRERGIYARPMRNRVAPPSSASGPPIALMLYRSWFLGHFARGNHAAAPVLGKSAWRTAAGVRWPWRSTSQAWL